jgi:hypothetical protein
MGLGYALTEELACENGMPVTFKLRDLGVLRARDMPEVKVILVEDPEPEGPFGAKSVGEIGLVPTAPAVAGALEAFDGIRRQVDPTEAGFGPIDANVFAWTNEQRATIRPLPASLKEALEALADDHEFLLAGDVFSEDLIQRWIAFKMDEEYYQVRNRPHPYEVELYFDV